MCPGVPWKFTMPIDQEAYDAVKGNDHRRLMRRLKLGEEVVDVHALNGAGLTMLHVACYQVHDTSI